MSCSQLHCVHFNTWDNSRDWTVPLPAKESVKVTCYYNYLGVYVLFTVGHFYWRWLGCCGNQSEHVTPVHHWRNSVECVVYSWTSGYYGSTCPQAIYSIQFGIK